MSRRFAGFEDKLRTIEEECASGLGAADAAMADKMQALVPAGLADSTVLKFLDNGLSIQEKMTIEECSRRIYGGMKVAIFEIGHALSDAKALIRKGCESGTWSKWLASLEISEATARNYMAAFEWERQCPKIRDLPRSVIYQGAAAPDKVRDAIERMLQTGVGVTKDQVSNLIKEHRQSENTGPLEKPVVIENTSSQKGNCSKSIRNESLIASQIIQILSAKFSKEEIDRILILFEQTSIDFVRDILKEVK